ncbi:unnamed protein product, partial [Amoebophrya sp. A120]
QQDNSLFFQHLAGPGCGAFSQYIPATETVVVPEQPMGGQGCSADDHAEVALKDNGAKSKSPSTTVAEMLNNPRVAELLKIGLSPNNPPTSTSGAGAAAPGAFAPAAASGAAAAAGAAAAVQQPIINNYIIQNHGFLPPPGVGLHVHSG